MSVRVFIQFRTSQVPGEASKKLKLVADAACSAALGRDFDDEKDFIHSQGEIYNDNAPCHIVIDCEHLDAKHTVEEIPLYCYALKDESLYNSQLLVLCSVSGKIGFR
jgi:hypothetical protein